MIQDHRLALGGDPPGKPPAHRYVHALAHLFLKPGGRGRDQLAGRDVKQQDRGGIGSQDLPDPVQQRDQQLTIIKAGQCRVGYRLDGPEPDLDRFRIYLRRHLDASRQAPPTGDRLKVTAALVPCGLDVTRKSSATWRTTQRP